MIKIVHCADLHIGTSFSHLPSSLASVRREEVKEGLFNIVNFSKEKGIDALLICGDLFDSPKPTKKDSDFVRNLLASLSPVPVYIICGNHDYMCADSIFSKADYFSDNVHIFPCFDHSFEIEGKNAVIYGKSYNSNMTQPTFDDCFFDESKVNIICLHGDTVPSSDYNTISEKVLSSLPVSYAAFGHIHNGEIFEVGNIKCAYSGTSEPHSFGDDKNTGFIYAEIDEKGTNLFPVSLAKRQYHNISYDITGQENGEIISGISEIIKGSDLYRITLVGEYTDETNIPFIKDALSGKAFFTDISDNTSPSYDFDSIEKEESLRGEFLRELRKICASEEEFIVSAKAGLDALSGKIPVMEEAL